jgi:hypothetical protein
MVTTKRTLKPNDSAKRMLKLNGIAEWRCQVCYAAGGRRSPTLLVGALRRGGRLEEVARLPVGEKEAERDLARDDFVLNGIDDRTGWELLTDEPFTNTCLCGHEVAKTGQELLDALRQQGGGLTAYI